MYSNDACEKQREQAICFYVLCGSRKYPYLLPEGIFPTPLHPSGNSS